MYLFRRLALPVEEISPRTEGRLGPHLLTALAQDGCVEPLVQHIDRHVVDARQVFALHNAVEIDVAEGRHLLADVVLEMLLRAQHEDVGLNTDALQFLHTVLRGLRLQFARRLEIGDIGQVEVDGTAAQLPLHLPDRLEERRRLYVADRTADLRDDEVVVVFLSEQLDVAFDFVRDVRHHLDGLAQIVATAFLVDDALVDASGGHGVGLRGLDAREAFVVPEVEVGFHAVHRHVALPVLVGVQRPRVDVDVRVEFLDGDVVAPCLEELTD